ncbi:MAG TPA: DUF4261 domain-containing protein [Pirellulales bacterium]
MGLFDFFRKNKVTVGSGGNSVESEANHVTGHCFVLCATAEPGDPSRAGEIVEQVFGRDHSAEIGHDGIVINVSRGNNAVGHLVHAPFHIPTQEAEECADRNFLWPNGKEEAAKHQSHVIVVNTNADAQTSIQSAITVSRLALVAMRIFDGIGVYWGNAGVSNSREVFENSCDGMSEQHLPVPMWVRFQVTSAANDEIGMYTSGMRQFGLMELEVDRCRMTLAELSGFVGDLAHYLLQRGPVINDEDTCGGSGDQRIVVRHRSSMIDEDRLVYKIIMD